MASRTMCRDVLLYQDARRRPVSMHRPPSPSQICPILFKEMTNNTGKYFLEKRPKRPQMLDTEPLCCLTTIARILNRPLMWDPSNERFVGDDEANRMVDPPRRKGYELPDLS